MCSENPGLNNGDNRLPAFWDKCYQENIFAPLELQTEYIFDNSHAGVFIDWYLGDGDFTYIVGILMKEGFTVPEGYTVRKLEETDAALCWVKSNSKSLAENRTVPFDTTDKAIKKIRPQLRQNEVVHRCLPPLTLDSA